MNYRHHASLKYRIRNRTMAELMVLVVALGTALLITYLFDRGPASIVFSPLFLTAAGMLGLGLYAGWVLRGAILLGRARAHLERDPTNPDIYYRLAWHLFEKDHVSEAVVHFRNAIQLDTRMNIRKPFCSAEDNFFSVHNWWHLALYHLDHGRFDDVQAIYDGPIREDRSSVALDMVDASALLWRLTLTDRDISTRWQELAALWDKHADAKLYPFNDWHAVMAYLGAGRYQDVERILAVYKSPSMRNPKWQYGHEKQACR